jgi:hypothetical protein
MHTTTAGAEERLITRNSRGGNNITWAKEEWAGPGVQEKWQPWGGGTQVPRG